MSAIVHVLNRRVLPVLLSALVVFSGPVGARTVIAEIQAGSVTKVAKVKQRGRIAHDLVKEILKPGGHGGRWSKDVKGRRLVQVVITSDMADGQMTSLRQGIEQLGGVVQVVHPQVKALTVALPLSAVKKVARLPEVLGITPNRDTASSSSTLEVITGATTTVVRPYSSATAYSGLDGTGVGIAIVDSGVMKAHRSFRDAANTASRVARSVSMLKANPGNWYDTLGYTFGSPQPGSAALNSYENTVAADNNSFQDPYGHGTHVASVAAGRGFYQSPDSTGMAPGATLYDVRVIGADGRGTVSDAIEGINWVMYHAREYNIRVMNLSIATSSPDPWDLDPLCHAVRAATAMGITVVVAGGNYGLYSGGRLTYGSIASPAHDPTVITVGAVNFKASNGRNDDTITNFSSRGPTRT